MFASDEMSSKDPNSSISLQTFITSKVISVEIPNICKQPFRVEPEPPFSKEKIKFECHKVIQESSLMQGYEFKTYFIYVFAHNEANTSKIYLYSFEKEDGSQSKMCFQSINGTITCLRLALTHDESDPDRTTFKLLIGTYEGFLKIVSLDQTNLFETIKLDVKPVKTILAGNYHYFNQLNVCIVLTSDSQVYFIDLQKNQIFYVLKPKIVMGDQALSISINDQYTHILQTTKGGYLIFWKIDSAIELCKERNKNPRMKGQKVYSVFPFCCDHSVAIEGILWCSFYGHLIILLTHEGWLKVIGMSFGTQSEYLQLSRFKVQDPESISSCQLFSSQDLLILTKNQEDNHFLQVIRLNDHLQVKAVRTITVLQIDFLQDIFLTGKFNILMCRGNHCFVINQCPELFYEDEEDRKYEHY